MTKAQYQYCILRFVPDRMRGEAVNVGIVVFHDDKMDFRFNSAMPKMKALVSGVSDDLLPGAMRTISDWTSGITSVTDRYNALRGLQFFDCSPLGQFAADDKDAYRRKVSALIHEWVSPSGTIQSKIRKSGSWLHFDLRRRLDQINVLSHDPNDLDFGMVLPYFPVDPQTKLLADFGFKVENVTIIGAIDLDTPIDNLKRTVAYKAFVFDKAKNRYGSDTQIVLAYSSRKRTPMAESMLEDLQVRSDRLVDVDSASDVMKFIEHVAIHATPNRQLPFH